MPLNSGLKDELTAFPPEEESGSFQSEHREKAIPFLQRLLWGRLRGTRGRKGKAGAKQEGESGVRATIFTYLFRLRPEELRPTVCLLERPFLLALSKHRKGDDAPLGPLQALAVGNNDVGTLNSTTYEEMKQALMSNTIAPSELLRWLFDTREWLKQGGPKASLWLRSMLVPLVSLVALSTDDLLEAQPDASMKTEEDDGEPEEGLDSIIAAARRARLWKRVRNEGLKLLLAFVREFSYEPATIEALQYVASIWNPLLVRLPAVAPIAGNPPALLLLMEVCFVAFSFASPAPLSSHPLLLSCTGDDLEPSSQRGVGERCHCCECSNCMYHGWAPR